MKNQKQEYDHIIIGSGPPGYVSTRRLINTGKKILLMVAGPIDTKPEIHDPLGSVSLWNSEVDWAFRTESQKIATIGNYLFQEAKLLEEAAH